MPAPPAALPHFVPTDPDTHRDELLRLNIEYVGWVASEVERTFGLAPRDIFGGQSVADYVAGKIDSVCGDPPPRGVFYLVRLGGDLAGMGGLRRVRDGVAELKRIYIRPGHRGARLGAAVIDRLLADARAFGYRQVLLDSAPFMTAAHRHYEAAGFTDCAAYPETEVPPLLQGRWRFMQRPL